MAQWAVLQCSPCTQTFLKPNIKDRRALEERERHSPCCQNLADILHQVHLSFGLFHFFLRCAYNFSSFSLLVCRLDYYIVCCLKYQSLYGWPDGLAGKGAYCKSLVIWVQFLNPKVKSQLRSPAPKACSGLHMQASSTHHIHSSNKNKNEIII